MPLAVLVVDRRRDILWANDRTRQLLGEAVAGRSLTAYERVGLVAAAILAAEVTVRVVEDPARHARSLATPSRGLAFGLALSVGAASIAVLAPPYAAQARTTSGARSRSQSSIPA